MNQVLDQATPSRNRYDDEQTNELIIQSGGVDNETAKEDEKEDEYEEDYSGEEDFEQSSGRLEVATGESRA